MMLEVVKNTEKKLKWDEKWDTVKKRREKEQHTVNQKKKEEEEIRKWS